jgi:hypothetical protein
MIAASIPLADAPILGMGHEHAEAGHLPVGRVADFPLPFGKFGTVGARITPAVPDLTALALMQRGDIEDGVIARPKALCVLVVPLAKWPSSDTGVTDQIAVLKCCCPQIDTRERGKRWQSIACLKSWPGIRPRP